MKVLALCLLFQNEINLCHIFFLSENVKKIMKTIVFDQVDFFVHFYKSNNDSLFSMYYFFHNFSYFLLLLFVTRYQVLKSGVSKLKLLFMFLKVVCTMLIRLSISLSSRHVTSHLALQVNFNLTYQANFMFEKGNIIIALFSLGLIPSSLANYLIAPLGNEEFEETFERDLNRHTYI